MHENDSISQGKYIESEKRNEIKATVTAAIFQFRLQCIAMCLSPSTYVKSKERDENKATVTVSVVRFRLQCMEMNLSFQEHQVCNKVL